MLQRLRFTKNEHLFRYEQTIASIFNQTNFAKICSFFSYLKCYRSNECILFTTNAKVYEMIVEHNFHFTVPFPNEMIKSRFYYFITSDDKYSDVVHQAKQFNIHHPFDSLYVYDDYYEMFCYGFNENNPNLNNYMINNLNQVEAFENDFRNKIRFLVEQSESNTIWLPEIYRTNIFSEYVKMINCNRRNINFKISRQQIATLTNLAAGYTIKETAKLMCLSPRTIESYLEIIKIKLSCKTKNEVIRKFIKNGNVG